MGSAQRLQLVASLQRSRSEACGGQNTPDKQTSTTTGLTQCASLPHLRPVGGVISDLKWAADSPLRPRSRRSACSGTSPAPWRVASAFCPGSHRPVSMIAAPLLRPKAPAFKSRAPGCQRPRHPAKGKEVSGAVTNPGGLAESRLAFYPSLADRMFALGLDELLN